MAVKCLTMPPNTPHSRAAPPTVPLRHFEGGSATEISLFAFLALAFTRLYSSSLLSLRRAQAPTPKRDSSLRFGMTGDASHMAGMIT
jgi:hypothetical protein